MARDRLRVHVVSDVHGRADALSRAADGADALLCLGDLLAIIDYLDPGRGVFGEMFGAVACARYIELRTAKQFAAAAEFAAGLFHELGENRGVAMEKAIHAQYAELMAALPAPAYVIFGNVDVPRIAERYLRPGHTLVDGQTVEISGRRFGFIGGGLPSPYRTPNEIDVRVHAARVAALGGVDVLCSHIPPAVPELLYDVVARRLEVGSDALLAAIASRRPRYALFGHVHQPLAQRTRVGHTECVNVGHFRATGRPHVLDV